MGEMRGSLGGRLRRWVGCLRRGSGNCKPPTHVRGPPPTQRSSAPPRRSSRTLLIILLVWYQNIHSALFSFVTIHASDGRTDGRTEFPQQYRELHYMQSHGKNEKSLFQPPFWTLKGNVHTPSMARWKAHGRLYIHHNYGCPVRSTGTPLCFASVLYSSCSSSFFLKRYSPRSLNGFHSYFHTISGLGVV